MQATGTTSGSVGGGGGGAGSVIGSAVSAGVLSAAAVAAVAAMAASRNASTSTAAASAAAAASLYNVEIEAHDVIKLILQFLREHRLDHTLRTLQEEAQVSFNVVDDVDRFADDILHGRWDRVLSAVSVLRLPVEELYDLFEQVVVEMAELCELDTARTLLRCTPAMQQLKTADVQRYLRLEHLLQRNVFEPHLAYPHGATKDSRRQKLAATLSRHVISCAPSRLLVLLTQAMRFQQLHGLLPKGVDVDLFRGAAPLESQDADTFPSKSVKVIKFGPRSFAESSAFSPDGRWLVSGSVDGYVEVWDVLTGKLASELAYQARDEIMQHESSVLAVAFSPAGDLLATGAAKGDIKVWLVSTGDCIRKFPTAHTEGVTSLQFTRDSSQVLSASHDHTVKIHGLKSGSLLKEFRGHTSFVNTAMFMDNDRLVYSGSSDGTIRVWDVKSAECLHVYDMSPSTSPVSILSLQPFLHYTDRVLVCERCRDVRVISTDGRTLQTFSLPASAAASSSSSSSSSSTGSSAPTVAAAIQTGVRATSVAHCATGDIISVACSAKGAFVYVLNEESVLYIFDAQRGTLLQMIKVHKSDPVGIAHHPHRNVLVSWSQDGTIKVWKP